jgi:ABC-type dipeptide/oligopeptide/nickel transport system permease subunit
VSPGKIIWNRLKQHKPAITGLCIIIFFTLSAIFCYWFVPDSSADSNRMSLPLSMQKPGTSVTILELHSENSIDQHLFSQLLHGDKNISRIIPLQRWKFSGDHFIYQEYTGDESRSEEKRIALKEITGAEQPQQKQQEQIKKNHLKSKTYWLGTDRYGRDLLSRLLVASRVSVSVGFIAVFISLFIGIILGSVAGFFRGWVDNCIMWLINVVWSIPTLLLVIAITLALGKGFTQVFIAVGLTMWVEVARLVRGQVFSLRELQFIEAGKALGYGNARIIFRHLLPNIIGPVIVIAASNFASAILLEAGLSFLGMGAQPPTPSWGMMIKENYGYIVVDAAYLAILPGMAIALMVLSFTMLGNGLRDAFDTRLSLGQSA